MRLAHNSFNGKLKNPYRTNGMTCQFEQSHESYGYLNHIICNKREIIQLENH